jgi:hypothetical protein
MDDTNQTPQKGTTISTRPTICTSEVPLEPVFLTRPGGARYLATAQNSLEFF